MNLRIKLKLVFITFVVLMLSVAAHSSLMAGATGIQELDDELNLIINPGFEEGGSVPLNWRFLNVNTDSSWQWDSEEKYEGNRSVKLTLTSTAQRAVIEQSNLAVEAGKLYDLRFYYRTEDLTGEPWVRIAWFDAERNLIRSSDIVLEKSDSHWSKFETHVQAPEKTSYAMIQAQVWKGTGHVWYDLFDLSAMEMDEQGDMPVEEGSIYHVSLPYHSESTEIAPFFTIS